MQECDLVPPLEKIVHPDIGPLGYVAQHDLAVRRTVARRVRQGHGGERTLRPSPAHELRVGPHREGQPLARQVVEGV